MVFLLFPGLCRQTQPGCQVLFPGLHPCASLTRTTQCQELPFSFSPLTHSTTFPVLKVMDLINGDFHCQHSFRLCFSPNQQMLHLQQHPVSKDDFKKETWYKIKTTYQTPPKMLLLVANCLLYAGVTLSWQGTCGYQQALWLPQPLPTHRHSWDQESLPPQRCAVLCTGEELPGPTKTPMATSHPPTFLGPGVHSLRRVRRSGPHGARATRPCPAALGASGPHHALKVSYKYKF